MGLGHQSGIRVFIENDSGKVIKAGGSGDAVHGKIVGAQQAVADGAAPTLAFQCSGD